MTGIQSKDPTAYPEWANANPIAAALMEIAIQLGRLADAQKLAAQAAIAELQYTHGEEEEEGGYTSLSDH